MSSELVPYELLYPSDKARSAADHLHTQISDHHTQLHRLRLFAADNADVINLLRRLPEHLCHPIMVPFGKAAFFPGRLVHTNEVTVLLGEGYYADQTASQAVGVLKRRGQVLEEKMEALSGLIADLEARAKFFRDTASQSGEGMVEIREYEEVKPESNHKFGLQPSAVVVSSEDVNVKMTVTDEEYAKVLAGLDKLEKAELAAEGVSNENEEKCAEAHDQGTSQDQKMKMLQQKPIMENSPSTTSTQTCEHISDKASQVSSTSELKDGDYLAYIDPETSASPKDRSLHRPFEFTEKHSPSMQAQKFQEVEVLPQKDKVHRPLESPANNPVKETPVFGSSQRKSFTGTIVERDTNLTPNLSPQNSTKEASLKPTKPISRFKMQKGL